MIFFTSDTHFGHANIIKYCNRPFASVEEMNEKLIANWNSIVRPEDTIYHLGDVSFMKTGEGTASILARLNGYKILVEGNHDGKRHDEALRNGFNQVHQGMMVRLEGKRFLLSHYPFQGSSADDRDFSHRSFAANGMWLLHGHVHTAWKIVPEKKMINVGSDVWDFKPVAISQLLALMV